MASSKRRRTKKCRPREGSRSTSDFLNGIDGLQMSETNPRNTDGDECFSEASNPCVRGSPTRRGRGVNKGPSRGDATHLKGQNDTQQFMQQNQNDVGKCSQLFCIVFVCY